MVNRDTLTAHFEDVEYLIKWWISREPQRYHLVRRRGTVRDFIQDIWLKLLKDFRDDKSVEWTLSTVVSTQCNWMVCSTNRNRTWFQCRMRTARPVLPADLVDESPTPEDMVIEREMKAVIDRLLVSLTYREALIVRARLGLLGDDPLTLEQVGAKLKVTRERVRQIETKGINKLKHHTRANKLKAFLPACHERRLKERLAKQYANSEYGAALFAELMKDDA